MEFRERRMARGRMDSAGGGFLRGGAKRLFRDAHPSRRCGALVVLSDKSTAQCGRAINRDYDQHGDLAGLCTQHAEMLHRGKHVTKWLTGRSL